MKSPSEGTYRLQKSPQLRYRFSVFRAPYLLPGAAPNPPLLPRPRASTTKWQLLMYIHICTYIPACSVGYATAPISTLLYFLRLLFTLYSTPDSLRYDVNVFPFFKIIKSASLRVCDVRDFRVPNSQPRRGGRQC